MAFQGSVRREPAPGVGGAWGSANMYYCVAALADDVIWGRFCSLETPENEDGIPVNPQRAVMGGTNAIGIAVWARPGIMFNPFNGAANAVTDGMPTELITQGDIEVYLTNADSAEVGQKVFYRTANSAGEGEVSNAGEAQAAAAGATVADFVESDWYVYNILDETTGLTKISTFRKG